MHPSENKQKTLKASILSHFPTTHLLTLGSLVVGLSALLFLFPSNNVEAKRHESLTLGLSERTTNNASSAIEQQTGTTEPEASDKAFEPSYHWQTETVKAGDNLSLIFQRAGLTDQDLYAFMSAHQDTKKLNRIHPGHTLAFAFDHENNLHQLRYQSDRLTTLLFTKTEDGFDAYEDVKVPEVKIASRQATIDSSLFLAAQSVQMDPDLIMELAGIFGWDIDFALDIRTGDSFKVVFEEKFLDGEKIGNGAILSAQFTNQGKTYKAVRYTDSHDNTHYYTPEGNTMRKEFLRTPIDFARISSHFNLRRKHPILNRIRAHKGTDYAAPKGTPIKAAGDGKVTFVGYKGGWGNVVIVQHGQTYKTLYAHMSKFGRGIKSGKRVKQAQVIGYVGATGAATGPHLHYEFYVNGSVRNPVTVKLPKAQAIAKSELERFKLQTAPLLAQLDSVSSQSQLAQWNSEDPQTSAQ